MSATDRQLLRRAQEIIYGDGSDQGGNNAVYAAYVAVIAAGTYGVPASHELFRFVDPHWLSAHASTPAGALVLVLAALGVLAAAVAGGGVHGPVVPPLPYLDFVLGSPIDRATALTRWWRLSLAGALLGGTLLGLVLGAGLVIAGSSPLVLLLAAALGVAFGLAGAWAWLWGQVRSGPDATRGPRTIGRARTSMRAMAYAGLREQAASTTTMGGAMLAGDLRTLRLDVASRTARTPHARRRRLRPSSPVGVIVRRDLLGLRRAPGPAVVGLLLSAAALWILEPAVSSTDAPSLVIVLGALLAYLGYGMWSEGLRIHSDNAGTVPLVGIDYRSEALAHLVLPSVLYAALALVGGVVLVLIGAAGPLAIAWAVFGAVLLAGGHLLAAFRGMPPAAVFSPRQGVVMIAAWYVYPAVVVLVVATATGVLTSRNPGAISGVSVLVVASYGVFAWGRWQVTHLADAHRD